MQATPAYRQGTVSMLDPPCGLQEERGRGVCVIIDKGLYLLNIFRTYKFRNKMNLVTLAGKQPLGHELREPNNGDLPKRYVKQVY